MWLPPRPLTKVLSSELVWQSFRNHQTVGGPYAKPGGDNEKALCFVGAMAKRPLKKPTRKKTVAKKAGASTVDVLNVLRPGKTYKRNAEKYAAARRAYLGFMPSKAPGLTQTEMHQAMKKALPAFGSTAGWWMKTVQLDAEARGEVIRDGGKPLRWRKAK
jgi:hypothetical protein